MLPSGVGDGLSTAPGWGEMLRILPAWERISAWVGFGKSLSFSCMCSIKLLVQYLLTLSPRCVNSGLPWDRGLNIQELFLQGKSWIFPSMGMIKVGDTFSSSVYYLLKLPLCSNLCLLWSQKTSITPDWFGWKGP